jgi:tetratricopeptide (TPR) repeat protein
MEASHGSAGFLISGMGGIGKTAFALKLAEHLKSRYPDAQFYLDVEGSSTKPLSPRAIMAYVVSSLRPDADMPKTRKKLEGLYRSLLEGQRALLFFDNVKDSAQIESLIPPQSSLVIATSRNLFSLSGFVARRLDVLAVADGNELLLKVAPRVGRQAEDLARVCGGLPLALRLAGGLLATRPDVSISQYLQHLSEADKRLELIDKSLISSYELLKPTTRASWRMLAVFRGGFDVPAAASVWNLELSETQEKLGEMLGFSMLDWDEQTKRYRLHDLAQLFADKRLESQERSAAKYRHAVHYERVSRTAYDVIVSRRPDSVSQGFELLYSDWVNIAAGQSWAAGNIDQNVEAARLCREYATRAAFFHLMKHDPAELARWLEAAVRGDRRLGDKKAEAADSGHLGNIKLVAGDLTEAVQWHNKALSLSRSIGDRKDEADELQRLMELHGMRNEIREAIKDGESALLLFRNLGDRVRQAETLAHLANLFKDSGDRVRSIEYYQSSLEINTQLNRPFETAQNLVQLGNTSDDPAKAISHYEAAIGIFRRLKKSFDEANTLMFLGHEYRETNSVSQSIEAFRKAARIFTQHRDSEREANALGQLAVTYCFSDESERGLEYAERSLAIAREISNEDLITLNLGVLVSVHGRHGRASFATGNMEAAVAHLNRQLAAAKELRALNKPLPEYMEADALMVLGSIALQQKKPHEAEPYLTEGLEIAQSTRNKEEEAKILDMLGIVFYNLGNRRQAIEYTNRSLRLFESLNDPKAALPRKHLTFYQAAS